MNIKDITDLNLHFLMLARHVAATDRASACTQLGLTETDIDVLMHTPLEKVISLAGQGVPLVRVALPIRVNATSRVDIDALQMTFLRNAHDAGFIGG